MTSTALSCAVTSVNLTFVTITVSRKTDTRSHSTHPNRHHLPYDDRLWKLRLLNLTYRRCWGGLLCRFLSTLVVAFPGPYRRLFFKFWKERNTFSDFHDVFSWDYMGAKISNIFPPSNWFWIFPNFSWIFFVNSPHMSTVLCFWNSANLNF